MKRSKIPNRVKNGKLSPADFSAVCFEVNGYDLYPNWPELHLTEFQRYQIKAELSVRRDASNT